jgi:hypothetical protein
MALNQTTEPLVREVNLTSARNLSPLFDEAVREERPVMIVRGRRERGLLLSRETMLRLLASHQFHVNVLPEEDGAYTLWLRELNIAGTGPSLREAREELLSAVRSYVQDYFREFGFYRHLPELAAQEPFIVRLSLARDENELIEMLFGARPPAGEAAPVVPAAG